MGKEDWVVPSDEALKKAFGQAVKRLREEAGLTIEEAGARLAAAREKLDFKATRSALGSAVRSYRVQSKLTRQQLAGKSNIPTHRLIEIERGTVSPDLGEIWRISYGMKIFPEQLMVRFERFFCEITGKPFNTEV